MYLPYGLIKGPLDQLLLWLLYVLLKDLWTTYGFWTIYFMLDLLPFDLIIKPLTFILWFYIVNIGPLIVLPLHLKYFMMIFYLSYLPYIRLNFSSVVSSSSEVSLLVHECPCLAFFFIFLLMTSAYSDSYFNMTGLPKYSTVTMQASTYLLCMIVLFCPTWHLLHEWASSLFLL